MFDIIIVITIVGTALYFAGRSLIRSTKQSNHGGCGNGCSGCSCASTSNRLSQHNNTHN